MKKILTFIFALTLLSSNSFADITFWTTEVQPARMEKQMEMAKSFESKTGIKVEVIPVEEKDLGSRATAAAAAGPRAIAVRGHHGALLGSLRLGAAAAPAVAPAALPPPLVGQPGLPHGLALPPPGPPALRVLLPLPSDASFFCCFCFFFC